MATATTMTRTQNAGHAAVELAVKAAPVNVVVVVVVVMPQLNSANYLG